MRYLVFVLVLIFAFPAMAEQSAYERVIESGTIRCGYAISQPSSVRDPNTDEMTGATPDVVRAIGDILGLKIEWAEEAGWGNFIEGLKTNRYDAFCSGMWPDGGRLRNLTLTDTVYYEPLFVYVREDDHRFDDNMDALNTAEMTMPIIEGDVTAEITNRNFPNAKQHALPQTGTVADMLLAVVTKKADATIMLPDTVDGYNKTNDKKLRRLSEKPIAVKAKNFGFKPGEYQLRDMFNRALAILNDDGTIDKIVKKHSKYYLSIRQKQQWDNK